MSDGVGFEILSVGKKDSFFKNHPSGASLTDRGWERRSAVCRDFRREAFVSGTRFGGWSDVPLACIGDGLVASDLRIQMGTWLPSPISDFNKDPNNVVLIEESEGSDIWISAGWTNGIANQLIERWALFLESIQLQEGWGDYNDWYLDSITSQNKAPLIHVATGTHDGSERKIRLNATPPELVFRIPHMGSQYVDGAGPFPLCAFSPGSLRFRVWLKDKTKLVESNSSVPYFEPWGGKRIKVNGVIMEERTLFDYDMLQPYIYARYTVIHLEPEARAAFRSAKHSLLYLQQRRDTFEIPASAWRGTQYKYVLTMQGLINRVVLVMQSDAARKSGHLTDYSPPGGGNWLTSLGITLNAVDRIFPWPYYALGTLAQNTQQRRDVNRELWEIVFGKWDTYAKWLEDPAGSINLSQTSTQKLVMNMGLSATVPPGLTYATVFGEAWNILDIQAGKAFLRFLD